MLNDNILTNAINGLCNPLNYSMLLPPPASNLKRQICINHTFKLGTFRHSVKCAVLLCI